MKWEDNIWVYVSFFVGAFICYLTCQFSYFQIKKELDIPSIILNIITLLIGLFIAITLQRKNNRSQNQHSYLINKLDHQWNSFNVFSQKITFNNRIDVSSIRLLITEVIHPSAFLKSIFESFNLDKTCVCNLENNLENLEIRLSNIPANNNIIDFSADRLIIQNMIVEINKCFSEVMKKIQNL